MRAVETDRMKRKNIDIVINESATALPTVNNDRRRLDRAGLRLSVWAVRSRRKAASSIEDMNKKVSKTTIAEM